MTFFCSDETICRQWVQKLKEQLSLLTCRPKHLLVYINPYGGKQQGKQIYEHKVAQLFTLASISTDVIVTEHANHARDHLKTQADLRKYDGTVLGQLCANPWELPSSVNKGIAWTRTDDVQTIGHILHSTRVLLLDVLLGSPCL
ncbi:UNVERIFIED_CONTAM: hypothetical protein FKN15_058515 [Acipenser sinensis]